MRGPETIIRSDAEMTPEEIEQRFADLENRVLGIEILLSEVVLYAHDANRLGVPFNKDSLSERLAKLILNRFPGLYEEENVRNAISAPIARLAIALKEAILIDDQGNPAPLEKENE